MVESMSEAHGDEGLVEPTERDFELALDEVVDEVMSFGRYPRKGRAEVDLFEFVSENCDPSTFIEIFVGALIDDRAIRESVERQRESVREMLTKHLKDSDMVDDLAVEFFRERRYELS